MCSLYSCLLHRSAMVRIFWSTNGIISRFVHSENNAGSTLYMHIPCNKDCKKRWSKAQKWRWYVIVVLQQQKNISKHTVENASWFFKQEFQSLVQHFSWRIYYIYYILKTKNPSIKCYVDSVDSWFKSFRIENPRSIKENGHENIHGEAAWEH